VANKKRRSKLPSICVDEHIPPNVTARFRLVLRTVEASKQARFRGRDEREYLRELFAQNTVFATSDVKFVEDTRSRGVKHAGLIYLPNRMTDSEKEYFAELAAVFVQGGCRSSSSAFHNCILYPAHDGVRLIRPRRGVELAFSWHWLREIRNA
jgi:hypothetical protein